MRNLLLTLVVPTVFSCSALSGTGENNTISFDDIVSACSGEHRKKTELNFIVSFKEGIKLGYSFEDAKQSAIQSLLIKIPLKDRKYALDKYYQCLDFTTIATRTEKIKIWNYYQFDGSCREAARYYKNNTPYFNEKINGIFTTGDIREYAKLLQCKIQHKQIRTSKISVFFDCKGLHTGTFLSFTNDTILCDTIIY